MTGHERLRRRRRAQELRAYRHAERKFSAGGYWVFLLLALWLVA